MKNKIVKGLQEAVAYARGDKFVGRETTYDIAPCPTSDLVDRLRDRAHGNDWYMRQEAADEIERLRAAHNRPE